MMFSNLMIGCAKYTNVAVGFYWSQCCFSFNCLF